MDLMLFHVFWRNSMMLLYQKGRNLPELKRTLFFWAVNLGLKYKPFGENGWFYEKKLKVLPISSFSVNGELHLGGNVRIVGCGGASLQSRLERIFWAAGIKILNMYGLTETSPIITINRTYKGRSKTRISRNID